LHDITTQKEGVPMLGPARPLSLAFLRKLAEGLGSQVAAEILPANNYLVSMSCVEKGLSLYRAEHVPQGDPRWSESYKCGDVNTSLIKTVRGRTIVLQHDTCSPRPYDRINLVSGSKGIFWDYPPRFFFDGMKGAEDGHGWDESIDKYKQKYTPPLWKQYGE
jgi:hypothetical protein